MTDLRWRAVVGEMPFRFLKIVGFSVDRPVAALMLTHPASAPGRQNPRGRARDLQLGVQLKVGAVSSLAS